MIGNYRTGEGETLDMNNGETREWLTKNYPAIMANRPVGMSEGYQFMPTWKLALNLQENFGMQVVSVGQQFSRKRDPSGQEHFVKLRMPAKVELSVGDSAPEMVLFNSHNGRSKIKAYAGIFRFVCANGMVVSESSFGKIDVRHFGEANNYAVFEELLATMSERFLTLDERLNLMRQTVLTIGQQYQLARMMMEYRKTPNWVDVEQLILHHREADAPMEDGRRNLWLTFNVVQENLTSRDDVALEIEGVRRRALRPLQGARANVLVNERVWDGLEQWLTRNIPAMGVVENTLLLPKSTSGGLNEEGDPTDGSPIEDAEILSETVSQKEAAPAEAVVAEDADQEDGGQEKTDLRHENAQETEVPAVAADEARRVELGSMKQGELRDTCKLHEIKGYGNMKKTDMIEAIIAVEFPE